MTPPTDSESKVNRKRKLMWWWIAGLLLVSSYPMEGLIPIALVLVIVDRAGRVNSLQGASVPEGKN